VGLVALVEALQRGGKAVWDPPDRPRLVEVPPDLRAALLADRESLREVLSRAAAFRRQLEGRSVAPVLTLPDRPLGDTGCISCGTDAPRIRCRLCSLACWIALGRIPPLSVLLEP
jgi:hypothetical protein